MTRIVRTFVVRRWLISKVDNRYSCVFLGGARTGEATFSELRGRLTRSINCETRQHVGQEGARDCVSYLET